MRNKKTISLKIAIVAVLGSSIIVGCEKQTTEQNTLQPKSTQEIPTIKKEVEIDSLKRYMSQLLGIDTSEIKYDATKKVFSGKEIGETSEEKLTELYNKYPINNYKNGVRVK